jgi:hypothetical protein
VCSLFVEIFKEVARDVGIFLFMCCQRLL